MKKVELQPREKDKVEAKDRVELFHDFIVDYIVRHPVYKLDKEFAKHIDISLEQLAIAKTKIK